MEMDLSRLIDAFSNLRVLVVGDAMLDAYLEGAVRRMCREAPLPVVEIAQKVDAPGGAANAAANVASLGAHVTLISLLGDDEAGDRLTALLERNGVDVSGVVVERGRLTVVKHRLVADAQMVARFDQEERRPPTEESLRLLSAHLSQRIREHDAVILSDYGYGLFQPTLLRVLERLRRRYPHTIVADSRHLERFAPIRPTAVKPSFSELQSLLGRERCPDGDDRVGVAVASADRLLEQCGARLAAITLDRDGVVVVERERPAYRTYARPVPPALSVGAGDTFVAAFTLGLAARAEPPAAAELGSAAAAVAVAKRGTARCSGEELRALLWGAVKRLDDRAALAARVAEYRRQRLRIVFTNGCYDLLHSGHVVLLNRAKGLGDVLIVGINSDESVERVKGPGRPINHLDERINVLSALSYIDHIVPFTEESPLDLIRIVKPDLFVKGGDYTRATLPEAALVEELGGAVCLLPYVPARGTSSLIERIRRSTPSALPLP